MRAGMQGSATRPGVMRLLEKGRSIIIIRTHGDWIWHQKRYPGFKGTLGTRCSHQITDSLWRISLHHPSTQTGQSNMYSLNSWRVQSGQIHFSVLLNWVEPFVPNYFIGHYLLAMKPPLFQSVATILQKMTLLLFSEVGMVDEAVWLEGALWSIISCNFYWNGLLPTFLPGKLFIYLSSFHSRTASLVSLPWFSQAE